MSYPDYPAFFKAATGGSYSPYDYQSRLALGEADSRNTGAACHSRLINIPTGLGKTAAVVLAWLWNRVAQPDAAARNAWPRRLVYCLPMRTLVEQTAGEVKKWIDAILADEKGELALGVETKAKLKWLAANSPVILMGGEDAGEWDIHPEREAILIGTQDMLLSRALNRGYGMSRYRWPMHFGLLNNDCLWVMDETQLMGVSVETSAQLDGLRAAWQSENRCLTWWMSATLDAARLATVDHPPPAGGWPRLTLSDTERISGRPRALFEAKKSVTPGSLKLSSSTKDDYAKQLAALIAGRHQQGTLTLVVVNRVSRAQEIFAALTTAEKKGRQPLYDPAHVALVHSRFRRVDRKRHEALLFGNGDRIVVATQAVEAGVDVSARLLITELAPWSSLVQRIGRCNRRAEFSDAEVLWVDIEADAKGELLLPYSKDDLDKARAAIGKLADASPRSLGNINGKDVEETTVIRPVIRRRDLVDLFDTTPDLCGQDLDISRYLRDEQDNDVQFFWREVGDAGPTPDEKPPQRDELCRVSIGDAAKFLGKKPRAWKWNPLAEEWEEAKTARPGAVYLVAADSGGYSEATGWTGDPQDKEITPCPPQDGTNESYAGNRLSFSRDWQTLADHTAQVVTEMKAIVTVLALDGSNAATLHTAAEWHDVGKAHGEFQQSLRDGPNQPDAPESLYAKSKNPPKRRTARTPYRSIRHELASALAWLLQGPSDAAERDLIAYLIAAHHGKVRLSIRSLPDEQGNPDDSEALFARGIWHGDTLPPVPGIIAEPTTLDLSFMRMGEGPHGLSWLARTVALRDRLGPFRLAFLETLLRAADARASAGADSPALANATRPEK